LDVGQSQSHVVVRRVRLGVVAVAVLVGCALWAVLSVDLPVYGLSGGARVGVVVALGMAICVALQLLLGARALATLEEKVEEYRIAAMHDPLTRLPNRSLFTDRVTQCAKERVRTDTDAAIVLIDLDRFKKVNESIGSRSADTLLSDIARRLATRLRRSDTLARLSGDEFVVLLPGVEGVAGATRVAEAIRHAMSTPFTVDQVMVTVSASVTVVMMDDHGNDATTLLERADRAMHRAKSRDDGLAVYDHEIDGVGNDELALTSDLRRAIATGELRLHYQPKANLANSRIRSVEALVRWEHPTRGLLAPYVFVPLAEKNGLIKQLTYWVLDEAMRQTREWADRGVGLRVAVNLSQQSLLDPSMPAEIGRVLERHQVPAKALEIEITESALVTDIRSANGALTTLDEMGIALSIDDYGTGHSSLAHVRGLPVSCIKIDRSFVSGMLTDATNATIVRSTVDLAKDLGITVVAEGVEEMEEWDALAELGCHLAQGYLISRPKPGEELIEWLTKTGYSFRMDAQYEGQNPMPNFN
jgi:diguanylate cyclase (GGDEF)-like protein